MKHPKKILYGYTSDPKDRLNEMCLVEKAPFRSKSQCAVALGIDRKTVANRLDTGIPYKNCWLFSNICLTELELRKWIIPKTVSEIITGELLGDGGINYDPVKAPLTNARLVFTFSSKILFYAHYLKYNVLASICTTSEPVAWPNPKTTGKKATLYWFSSIRLASITLLHKSWYKKVAGKYQKILPLEIDQLLTPLALAHWIMGDGYFSEGSSRICTDNFTKDEVLILIDILQKKFDIKASIVKRKNPNNTIVWRIRISWLSMEKLKLLINPYMIPEMLYKLGIK